MKCPRCGLIVTDEVPACEGCHFTIADLDKLLPKPPQQNGSVNDFAGLFSQDEQQLLTEQLIEFSQKYAGELVIITIQNADPVKASEYVFWLFNRWQIGDDRHKGIAILLAEENRRVESEVGYGWEPIISDPESGEILDTVVVPQLKNGDYFSAMQTAIRKIDKLMQSNLDSISPETDSPKA